MTLSRAAIERNREDLGDKVTSRDRDQVAAVIAASDLASLAAPRAPRPRDENPANRPDLSTWRARAQSKGTWLGARISRASALGAIEQLASLRADVEDALREEVDKARNEGEPWSRIGPAIGTTPEAARQRYGARS